MIIISGSRKVNTQSVCPHVPPPSSQKDGALKLQDAVATEWNLTCTGLGCEQEINFYQVKLKDVGFTSCCCLACPSLTNTLLD